MTLPPVSFYVWQLGCCAPPMSRIASAQTYPSRPVAHHRGFAAGGGSTCLHAWMGQRLSERLGQSFIIENRPARHQYRTEAS